MTNLEGNHTTQFKGGFTLPYQKVTEESESFKTSVGWKLFKFWQKPQSSKEVLLQRGHISNIAINVMVLNEITQSVTTLQHQINQADAMEERQSLKLPDPMPL